MGDHRLTDAFNAWEELSQTPESIIAYESRLKKIIDDEAKIDYARYKGKEEAKAEFVRNMLSDGLPLERVAKYAELTMEQVKEIQSQLE